MDTELRPLAGARVCLWGPPTNVLRSWHELAAVLGLSVTHACDAAFHQATPGVQFTESCPSDIDIVITDGWPSGVEAPAWSLTEAHLAQMGQPKLLPTPPFAIGRELAFDPLHYPGFTGYRQKELLLPVQKAILRHCAG